MEITTTSAEEVTPESFDIEPVPVRKVWASLARTKHTSTALEKTSNLLKWFSLEDVPFLKKLYENRLTYTKFVQMDSLFQNLRILKRMRDEYHSSGEMHPQYHQIQRNIDALTAKIRKQEEGIKITGDIIQTHDQIRKVIELQEYAVRNPDAIRKNRELVRDSSVFKGSRVEEQPPIE